MDQRSDEIKSNTKHKLFDNVNFFYYLHKEGFQKHGYDGTIRQWLKM